MYFFTNRSRHNQQIPYWGPDRKRVPSKMMRSVAPFFRSGPKYGISDCSATWWLRNTLFIGILFLPDCTFLKNVLSSANRKGFADCSVSCWQRKKLLFRIFLLLNRTFANNALSRSYSRWGPKYGFADCSVNCWRRNAPFFGIFLIPKCTFLYNALRRAFFLSCPQYWVCLL